MEQQPNPSGVPAPDTITFPSLVLRDGTVVEPSARHVSSGWIVGVFHHDPELVGAVNIVRVIPNELRGLDTSYAARFAAGMGLLVNTFGYVRSITGDDCNSSDPVLAE